jgi:hypothetical protein
MPETKSRLLTRNKSDFDSPQEMLRQRIEGLIFEDWTS